MWARRYGFALGACVAAWGGGCTNRGDVELQLGPLTERAALDGIALDEIVLRVSGPGFEPIEEALTPTTETVSLQVPAGPARRFELLGIRRIDAPDLSELAAYFGEVEQDVTMGSNEIRLPFREQGAINLEPEVLGGLALAPGTRLTIVDDAGAQLEVPFEQSIVVPVGRYRFVSSDADPDLLRAPSSLEIEVGPGQFVRAPVPLFNQSTQCLIDAPDSVRDEPPGCAELDFEVLNLDVANVTLRINGVEVQVDRDGNIVGASGDLVLNPGATIDIEFVSAGDNPRQECTVSPIPGGETFDVRCGELLYPINVQVFGEVGDGFDVQIRDGQTEDLLGEIPVETSGMVASAFALPLGPQFEQLNLNAVEPVDSPVECTVTDRARVVDGASAPIRIYCLSAPVPVYSESANLGDYILNDGSDVLSATGTPCPEDADGFDACLHAGLFKRFVLPGFESCDGLVVRDLVGALEWDCRVSGTEVEIFSHSLVSLRSLFSLQLLPGQDVRVPIAFELLVSINDQNETLFLNTPSFVPWTNSLANGDLVRDFDAPGTIYVLTESAPGVSTRFIEARGVTLVVPSSRTVAGALLRVNAAPFSTISGGFTLNVNDTHVATFDSDWLTITGEFSGAGSAEPGVGIILPRHGSVRHADVRGYQTGVLVGEAYGSVEESMLSNMFIGVELEASHSRVRDSVMTNVLTGVGNDGALPREDVRVRGVRATGAATGVQLRNTRNIHVSDLEVIGSAGVILNAPSNAVLRHISISQADVVAFEVNQSSQNVIIEGVVGEGRNGFTIRSTSNALYRNSAVYGDFIPVQITDGSTNVRAEGTFIFSDSPQEQPSCVIFENGSDIGFVVDTCVDPDSGLLPPPSTAQAINVRSGASPGYVDPGADLSLRSDSPLLGLSSDPDSLRTDTMVWLTDVSDAEECRLGFFGSVYNAGSGTCETTFLHHADEIEGDGDDFCESGELCRYLPDPGAAQRPATSFVEASIDLPGATDIRLLVPEASAVVVQ